MSSPEQIHDLSPSDIEPIPLEDVDHVIDDENEYPAVQISANQNPVLRDLTRERSPDQSTQTQSSSNRPIVEQPQTKARIGLAEGVTANLGSPNSTTREFAKPVSVTSEQRQKVIDRSIQNLQMQINKGSDPSTLLRAKRDEIKELRIDITKLGADEAVTKKLHDDRIEMLQAQVLWLKSHHESAAPTETTSTPESTPDGATDIVDIAPEYLEELPPIDVIDMETKRQEDARRERIAQDIEVRGNALLEEDPTKMSVEKAQLQINAIRQLADYIAKNAVFLMADGVEDAKSALKQRAFDLAMRIVRLEEHIEDIRRPDAA